MSIVLSGDAGITFPNGTAQASAGQVLQVISVTKTDTFITTATSDTAITGLAVTITPKSATSKILILCNFVLDNQETYNTRFNLYRNASLITGYQGAASGSHSVAATAYRGLQGGQSEYNAFSLGNMSYLDSPASTSAQTYQVYCSGNSGQICINRSYNDLNSSDGVRTASTITVMEIAA